MKSSVFSLGISKSKKVFRMRQRTILLLLALFISLANAETGVVPTPQASSISAFQHATIWAVVVGTILAFVLGFGMGANDVSNAFGTSVGSKVLTLKQAYILASIFETLGAILVGYNVTDTIRKGVFDPSIYADNPKALLLGQVAILGGCSGWLMIATFAELPVSTTQSVVGASLGFALTMSGMEGIKWFEIWRIGLSWICSPLLSGIISGLLYLAVDFSVLRRKEPLEAGLRVMPIFYFGCIAFNTFTIIYEGGPQFLSIENIWIALAISGLVGMFASLTVHYVLKPKLTNWIHRKNTIATIQDRIRRSGSVLSHPPPADAVLEKNGRSHLDGNYVIEVPSDFTELPIGEDLHATGIDEYHKNNNHDQIFTIEHANGPVAHKIVQNRRRQRNISESVISMNYVPQRLEFTPKGLFRWLMPVQDRKEDKKTLRLFSSIQVFTACFAGFAHGSNDVSNAIAPLTAILAIYGSMSVSQDEPTPIYVLLFGVFAMCVGLCLLGHKVIKTVGQRMSEIHAASGFTIEFGAAVTALLASKIGIPISTTHCLVGSVVSVGCIKSGAGIKWSVFRNVVFSWLVTLPVAGLISAGIMLLLKFTAL